MDRKILKDFKFLKKDVEAITLFGSHARKEQDKVSDIDICIVCKKRKIKNLRKKCFKVE